MSIFKRRATLWNGGKKCDIILYSRPDQVMPFADSEELVRNSGLPPESLIEAGFEHRLADEKSLEAMLRAVEESVE